VQIADRFDAGHGAHRIGKPAIRVAPETVG